MGFKNLSDLDFISLSGFKNIDSFFTLNFIERPKQHSAGFFEAFYDKNLVDYPEMIQ
jgi:hypothetical protein